MRGYAHAPTAVNFHCVCAESFTNINKDNQETKSERHHEREREQRPKRTIQVSK